MSIKKPTYYNFGLHRVPQKIHSMGGVAGGNAGLVPSEEIRNKDNVRKFDEVIRKHHLERLK